MERHKDDQPLHGRGSVANPAGRFETLSVEPDDAFLEHAARERGARSAADGSSADGTGPDSASGREAIATEFLTDTSKSIISRNSSPDIPFDVSLNPYRGCEHGCVYCYARPTHEFLGFSPGLDFETKIMVKHDAPALLRDELLDPRWQPKTLALSGVTDAYQPVEKKLEITRQCLEVLSKLRHPVMVVTKNPLVARDADLLSRLAAFGAAGVYVSITTLDADLARVMEPRAGHPRRRLEAIRQLADAGVPVGVLVAPIVPGLNDHEPAAILEAAAAAGASFAGFTILRLPGAVAGLFDAWLAEHFPDRRSKVMNRVRALRGGAKINDSRFGHRMRGQGPFYDQIASMFQLSRRKHGLVRRGPTLSIEAFDPPGKQLGLFT